MGMAHSANVIYNVSKRSIPPALMEVSLLYRVNSLLHKIAVGITHHYLINGRK